MDQVELLKQIVAPPIVTRGAGQIDVFEIATTAARTRQNMIILSPHALKCRMLGSIRSLPGHRPRILFVDRRPHFVPNDRYLAESAVMSISLMDQPLGCFRCIPRFGPQVLGNDWWIIHNPMRLVIDRLLSPNGIEPISDDLVVSQTQKLFRHVTLASQVGGHRFANTMGGDLDFRDRLTQAFTKAHSNSIGCSRHGRDAENQNFMHKGATLEIHQLIRDPAAYHLMHLSAASKPYGSPYLPQ